MKWSVTAVIWVFVILGFCALARGEDWTVIDTSSTPKYVCKESLEEINGSYKTEEYCNDFAAALNIAHEKRKNPCGFGWDANCVSSGTLNVNNL